ncbi:MAG: acetylxylan esterase, partial [Bacteroidetes bacterium QS_8_68_28]
MMDYAVQTEAIDADRAIAVGHSRLAKTALWAGANDRRFAAVIDNASGCGGSALFRRRYGERVVHIDKTFPHW